MKQYKIHETPGSLSVSIRKKKNKVSLIFMLVWLIAWIFGGLLMSIIFSSTSENNSLFFQVWMTGWAIATIVVSLLFIKRAFGCEILEFGNGYMIQSMKAILVYKKRIYHLNDIKKIRARTDQVMYHSHMKNNYHGTEEGFQSCIEMENNGKLVRIAKSLSKDEVHEIIELLLKRRFISESQVQAV